MSLSDKLLNIHEETLLFSDYDSHLIVTDQCSQNNLIYTKFVFCSFIKSVWRSVDHIVNNGYL
jgi:hypothetical protein